MTEETQKLWQELWECRQQLRAAEQAERQMLAELERLEGKEQRRTTVRILPAARVTGARDHDQAFWTRG